MEQKIKKNHLVEAAARVYSGETAAMIQSHVVSCVRERSKCSVMLTGGRSAAQFYSEWTALPDFSSLTGVNFYFGDERCVSPNSSSSNYALVMSTLFKNGVPRGCTITRIRGEDVDCTAAAYDYERKLPEQMDVLLLSLGDDGHVASLFPQNNALKELHQRVVVVDAPLVPYRRITITPQVLMGAKHVFVLAFGEAKEKVLKRVLYEDASVYDLPAKLVADATWFLEA